MSILEASESHVLPKQDGFRQLQYFPPICIDEILSENKFVMISIRRTVILLMFQNQCNLLESTDLT